MKRFCFGCALLAAAVGIALWLVREEEPGLFGSKWRLE